jgi:uncharacterized protein
MNPYRQKQLIKAAKTQTGWAYSELPWFSPKQAEQANRIRQDLLVQFAGALRYSFNGTKPHLGPLSLGCQLCGTSNSIYHFINSACTRTCCFCPQDRSQNIDSPPEVDGIPFVKDEDFINYLKTFHIKRVGITGGEPLLVLDKLISRIKSIRKNLRDDVYIWLNTNGDLTTRETLLKLHAAGLNEIKFNICAQNYDLSAVKLALSYIPLVTVEIPAIPEDLEITKTAILEMEAIGVSFLNLIQLEISQDNYRKLGIHQFHLHHRQFMLPVFESEICALQLMLFRQEKGLRLPVSYCGFPYRFEMTNAMRSKRYNQFELKGWEEVTETGLIRTFALKNSTETATRVAQLLEKKSYSNGLWSLNADCSELTFHRKLLPLILDQTTHVVLQYLQKTLSDYAVDSMKWKYEVIAETLMSQTAIKCWRHLYIEHGNEREALKKFVRDYPLDKDSAVSLKEEMEMLKQIGPLEIMDVRYPETIF